MVVTWTVSEVGPSSSAASGYLPTPSMIQFRSAVRQLDETVYGIIAARRRNGQARMPVLLFFERVRDVGKAAAVRRPRVDVDGSLSPEKSF